MDPAYMGGMSPSYVPRKRKTAPPQQRSSVPYPVVQRMPERSFEMSVIGLPRNDEAQALEAQKMKRTYGRKRYEDLQNVTPGPVGVGYPVPDTSCCSVMSSSLANGMEGGFAPPLTRMPPRLVAKDCWPSPGLSSSLSLGPSPGPIPGPVPHLDQGRDRGQEQAWRNDFIMKKMPRVEMERSAPAVTSFAPEVRLTVPAPVSSGYVQTNPDAPGFSQNSLVGGSFSQNSLVSGTFSQASPTPSQSSEEPKNKTPISFSTKKEPPVYPPGSQEERWQLQILDKGRVTCPKCKSVSRKTVEGLKKHMESCRLTPFTCQHCGKQLKSSTGMKYHIMADHSNLPSPGDGIALDDHSVKEKLRKVLKRLGRLKCSKEGCTGSFTSIMGYLYHMKKCGKEESELEKLLLNCSHCGKAYKSKAGLEYHLKSEHAPVPQPVEEEEGLKAQREPNAEWSHSGRVQRQSAQVAVFHLQEIANDELSKDWPKKKFLRDLVPDDRKLKYTRPGLPSFSQEVLRKWKNEVKLQRKVQCPNQGCDCVYTSVSGLKAHLGLCTRGDFEAGKYRCLICNKEFNSESGVKYHINSVHSQDWFVVNKKASIKFEKFLKMKPKYSPDESSNHHHHLHLHHLHHLDLLHHQQQHQHHQEIHQHHHHQHQHQQQHQQQPQQHLQQQLVEQPHHQQFLSHHEHHLQYQHPHIHDQNQPLLQQLQLQPHPPSPSPQSSSTPPWSPGWSVGLNPPTHRGRHRGRWRGRGESGGEAEGGSLTAERAAAAAEAPAANQRLRRPGDRDITTNGL